MEDPLSRPAPVVPLLAAVVLVALNLRPAVASVPPLLDTIQRQLGLSSAAAGLLTTLPVLCMGVFAPAGSVLARRLGRERALGAALGVVAAGTFLRGAAPDLAALFGGTLLVGVGIAVAGALLPGLVKAYFPHHTGAATGLYTAGLTGGAAIAAAATVPVSSALGLGWDTALAAWGLLAVAALLVWWPLARRAGGALDEVVVHGLPWRHRTAWLLALYTGGQSLLYYTALTWLAPLYVSRGWTPGHAGLLLAVFSVTQVLSALAVPAAADRTGDHRPWLVLCTGTTGAVLAVLALAPGAAPWLWVVLLGLAVGGAFALALTMVARLAHTPDAAARLSGMTFLVGYLVAASGPVLAGVLRDAFAGFRVPYLALAGLAVLTLTIGAAIRPSARVG